MTPADKLHFARIIARLAVAQREKDLDALTTRAYFEGLKDREIEFVEMAAERIAFTATWFPKLAEWRREAIAIEAERVESQKAFLSRLREPLCAACGDSGWREAGPGRTAKGSATSRAQRCECANVRRAELLGRRPWPAALPASPVQEGEIDQEETVALMRTIEEKLGRSLGPRVVPRRPWGTSDDDE